MPLLLLHLLLPLLLLLILLVLLTMSSLLGMARHWGFQVREVSSQGLWNSSRYGTRVFWWYVCFIRGYLQVMARQSNCGGWRERARLKAKMQG